jgi:RNA polymerase sigma-70 factor (ECF subfamily)
MTESDVETEVLIVRARGGDAAARQQLLARYQQRLRQMIAVRLDRRLAARLDPSDVLQDVFLQAAQKLPRYLQTRPRPFYPWLRQLAWERLVKLHHHHLHADKRRVTREEPPAVRLSDQSVLYLAQQLAASGTSPSNRMLRDELRSRVRAALGQLPERDREVLVLRYLEQLATAEIVTVLGLTDGAVKTRHWPALDRLRVLLNDVCGEEQP